MTDFIIQKVIDHYRVSTYHMRSRNRDGEYVKARHLFFYLMREHTRATLNDIGAVLSRDHATVLHGWRSVKNQIELYSDFRKEIEPIQNVIRHMIAFRETADEEMYMENDCYVNN